MTAALYWTFSVLYIALAVIRGGQASKSGESGFMALGDVLILATTAGLLIAAVL